MKIILLQDVANLGEEGDIKEVANGYARNYLLPQKKAMHFTKANLNILEQKKSAIEKRKEEKRNNAKSLKEKISEMEIVLEMVTGEKGRLFGAVTTSVIAAELEKNGVHVEKKKVELNDTIKVVGKYKASVKLYGGETAEFSVEVKEAEKKED